MIPENKRISYNEIEKLIKDAHDEKADIDDDKL